MRIFGSVILAFAILHAGCATIIKGTTERVYITASPSSARVEVDGVPIAANLSGHLVKRDRDHVIKVTKKGYKTKTVRMESGFSVSGVLVSILGNGLIIGGILGIIVDVVTGSWYGFDPDEINVVLERDYDFKPASKAASQEQPRGTLCVKCGFYFPRNSRFCNQCGERSSSGVKDPAEDKGR